MAAVDLTALRDRVRAMEGTTQVREPLSRSPLVDTLLPGGLRAGATYAVHGSHSLLAALLAGGSAQGRWCGLVGLPDLGVEAVAALGVDLTRTLVVPDPGEDWADVTATLVEAVPLVGARPVAPLSPRDAGRLAARLRARSSALVLHSPTPAPELRWPGLEASIYVLGQAWAGITDGRGRLLHRVLDVEVRARTGAPRRIRLLQDATGGVAPFAPVTTPLTEIAAALDGERARPPAAVAS